MSEWDFMVLHPVGYGLHYGAEMSFHPGTSMDEVPTSLVLNKAKELLSEDALQKLKELQGEIDQVKSILAHMPATTFQEQLQRIEPQVQLGVLNAQKELFLKTPREEAAKELAAKACKHYRKRLNNQLADLKATLPQAKHEDIGSYFEKEVGDPRYLGDSFGNLVPADERKETGISIQNNIEEMYQERVSVDLRKYVTYQCNAYLFALPHAEYCLEEGVPCLDIGFYLSLVVKLEFKEIVKAEDQFYGCEIKMEFAGETLGCVYSILEPDPPFSYWQTIPISFIESLLHGELLPDGAKVLSSGSGVTEYEIDDLQVTIPDDFADYMVEVGKEGGLEKLGIIEKKTASIIENLHLEGYMTAKNLEVEKAVAKLIELGQTKVEANQLISTMVLPPNITAEEIVALVLKKQG